MIANIMRGLEEINKAVGGGGEEGLVSQVERSAEALNLAGATGQIALLDKRVVKHAQPSVNFLRISPMYEALLILGNFQTDVAAVADNVNLRFNDDTANNYMYAQMFGMGDASGPDDSGSTGASGIIALASNGANGYASGFPSGLIIIPNYASPHFYKSVLCAAGRIGGGVGSDLRIFMVHGVWRSEAPIQKITFYPNAGTNIAAKSTVTLWGLK